MLREALMLLPNENYIYYADSDNAPYGTKTREKVKRLTFDAVKFLNERKIKALVIACNTATSAAVRDLRKAYNFPVIGMEPAVKPAVQMNNNGDKRVLVLATALTLKEEKFQNLISRFDSEHIVDMLPAPKLVEFAEKFIFYGPEVSAYIKEIMPENIDQYGTLVLGCTHFPFFKQALEESIPGSINIIDGNRGTVNHLMSVIKNNNLLSPSDTKGKVTFYKSGVQVKDQTILERYKNILYDTKAEKHTF